MRLTKLKPGDRVFTRNYGVRGEDWLPGTILEEVDHQNPAVYRLGLDDDINTSENGIWQASCYRPRSDIRTPEEHAKHCLLA